jgi:hypothetical protein
MKTKRKKTGEKMNIIQNRIKNIEGVLPNIEQKKNLNIIEILDEH